jgi:ribonuclease PH
MSLSNCYVPLALSKPSSEATIASSRRKRSSSGSVGLDQRHAHELRQVSFQTGVISEGSGISPVGSAKVCLGRTEVVTKVFGPLSAGNSGISLPSHVVEQMNADTGTLYIRVQYIPHLSYPTTRYIQNHAVVSADVGAGTGSGSNRLLLHSFLSARESALCDQLQTCLQTVLPLQHYPKTCILLHVVIFYDDGGSFSAALSSCVLALVRAKFELYDLITACRVLITREAGDGDSHTASKDKFLLLADPDLDEEEYPSCGDAAIMTLALLPNWKEVCYWEQSGSMALPPQIANQALELCRDGCRTMHRLLRQHCIDQQEQGRES